VQAWCRHCVSDTPLAGWRDVNHRAAASTYPHQSWMILTHGRNGSTAESRNFLWSGEGPSRLRYSVLYAHISARTSFDKASSHAATNLHVLAPRLNSSKPWTTAHQQVGGNFGSDVGVGLACEYSES